MRRNLDSRALLCSASLRVLATTVVAPIALFATDANADVTISTHATKNMTCSGGVCKPTAPKAFLNVSDLETFLASGNVTVTTTGSFGVEASDVVLTSTLTWSTSTSLKLDAYQSIKITKPVAVTGLARLALVNNHGGAGGTISFSSKGNITFANLSSTLTINSAAYGLVNTISALASAISVNPDGNYALARSYDASKDGIYSASPIGTTFVGSFEGLGNIISNLSISDPRKNQSVGLFGAIGKTGVVASLHVSGANVYGNKGTSTGSANFGAIVGVNNGLLFNDGMSGRVSGSSELGGYPYNSSAGGLAGANYGKILDSHSSGKIFGAINQDSDNMDLGGITGTNFGTVANSSSRAKITATEYSAPGGLVGGNSGTIKDSFATGTVTATKGLSWLGGLAGYNFGSITNSYATGSVTSADGNLVGGFVGFNKARIQTSYSSGSVTGPGATCLGGFIGQDVSKKGHLSDTYWDTDTSGVTNMNQGAGCPRRDRGITGLTTTQFQSGLPTGFDPEVWAEKSNVNGGLPYLIANPPSK